MPYEPPPWTQIIAHRGNSGPLPENTMAAIESAIDLGADMVEVDVRLTKDKVPILLHNDRLGDTPTGSARVEDVTWAELETLDRGSWRSDRFADHTVPNLADVLDLTRGRVALNLDLKVLEAVEAAVGAVLEAGVSAEVVISGCAAECVRKVRDLTNGIATLFNLDELLVGADPADFPLVARRSVDVAVELGAIAINVPHALVDAVLVEEAKAAGIGVWTWTVDDESRMADLVAMGVASLTTNWPERMLPLVKGRSA